MNNDDAARALKARLDNLPVSDDYGTRSLRRRQVIALYGGYAALIPIYAIGYDMLSDHGRTNVTIAVISVVLLIACVFVFGYGFYALLQNTLVNAPNIRDERLDERWIARRNRAVLISFRVLAMGLAAAALYSELAFSATKWEWLRNPYLISWFLWLGALLGMTLPTAVMAWNEPDPLPEDPGL